MAALASSGSTSALGGGGLGGLLGGSTPLHDWGALVTQPLRQDLDQWMGRAVDEGLSVDEVDAIYTDVRSAHY